MKRRLSVVSGYGGFPSWSERNCWACGKALMGDAWVVKSKGVAGRGVYCPTCEPKKG